MQQYLPFTVLKLLKVFSYLLLSELLVATVLTVYGIETSKLKQIRKTLEIVATVLTVYGIET